MIDLVPHLPIDAADDVALFLIRLCRMHTNIATKIIVPNMTPKIMASVLALSSQSSPE